MSRSGLCSIVLLFLFYSGEAAAVPDPIAWNFWNVQGEVPEVDHEPWQHFLDRYLVASPDGINRVRYQALTAEDRAALSAYVSTQAALDPRGLTRVAQQAYWINLYNALTVQFANELRDTPIKVNAADPGYTATDMTFHDGARTPDMAARPIVRLATLPADGPSGGFFDESGVVPW